MKKSPRASLLRFAALVALALVAPLAGVAAEERERGVGDVVYVPTPQIVVDEMLSMAKTGPKDFMIDLGSGDAASRHEFRGTIKGDVIDGTVSIGNGNTAKQLPWNAKLVAAAK